ncbi:MAG TPA: alpha/beta fold hydrolase [Patescibacteria group bacterium]|nr:alpha/beta fold hydrolase [Patescibacteria group bacterium]
MKTAYLIHGWGCKPEAGFRPWLKEQLEACGYNVVLPVMPDPNVPLFETWISYLQFVIADLDEETVLVGHSLGGLAILHFLQRLSEGVRVGKVVLVAPVIDEIMGLSEEEKSLAKPWLEMPIDAEKIRRSAKEIIGFFSDNDPWIPLRSEQVFRERYGAKTFVEHDKKHWGDHDGVTEVRSVLEAIFG